MSSHPHIAWAPPGLLGVVPGWSPAYFAGAVMVTLRAAERGPTISELGGATVDGWHVSETPGAMAYDARVAMTPIYRQGNVGRLQLELNPQHWAAPRVSGPWCVQPGDVVVNKLAPVRAALVGQNARRHPVDGNTLLIRGLSRCDATWLAVCLNQPGYEERLLIESGVLRRVGIGALNSLRLPPVPRAMEGLSARLEELLDAQTLAGEALHHTRIEAAEVTREAPTETHDLSHGAFISCDALTNENWLPASTALRAEQAALGDVAGWVALGDLAAAGDRARLSAEHDAARSIRVGDVGDDYYVTASGGATGDALIPSRTLAAPLVPGDVLLSTLGSSLRVAWVDDDVPQKLHPSDGWVRLRFRETPAAWALLLSTDALRSQAARLAVGNALQFVPPDALLSLRMPTPPRALRDRWQRAVERHHAQRRELDRRWDALISELAAVFDDAHRPFTNTRMSAREVSP